MATYVLVHGACHDGSAFDRDVFREMFSNPVGLAEKILEAGRD
jgi:hypothetical protein